jgi:maltose O-acetyltransferase
VIVNSIAMLFWMPRGARRAILGACGYSIGRSTVFSGSIIRSDSLTIGDGCFINHRCLFDRGTITIGDSVFLSSGVTLATGGHELGGPSKRAGTDTVLPIVIGDGAWIGANVVVLGGVTIAAGSVVGAGAIVTVNTEPNGIYVGVPARLLRMAS